MLQFNQDEEKQKSKLKGLREKEEEDLAKLLAPKYRIPYMNLSIITIDLDSLKIVPEKEAREGKMAVFQSVGKSLQVAVLNPDLPSTKEILKTLENKKYKPQLFLVSKTSLDKVWSRYREVPEFTESKKGIIDVSSELLKEFLSKVANIQELHDLLLSRAIAKENRKISEVFEIILAGALSLEASDVHIEPEEKNVKLRLRLDGVLQDLTSIENRAYQLLLSRMKLVSELKLNIHDKAQDGRFTIRTKDADVEVRTSVLPGPYGESVVLRILNPRTIAMNLEALGTHAYLYEIILREIKKPNGMILVTGPTGSGKTTTLYAFVKKIRTSAVKIITIEDPIEYHLEGITQTQVESEKEYDFANGLKSILRQDPDIILVGEIRDLETAQTAVHASLTGHLVFSTLHTNNAAGAIPRLIDLGVNPSIIAPAINISLAQRLVRRLCKYCREEYPPNPKEKKFLEESVSNLPKKIPRPPNFKNLWRAPKDSLGQIKGCVKCNNTGYKGRVGIFEAFLIDEPIERLITKGALESDIQEAALSQGMLTMAQDGVLKTIEGVTSLEELERVVELKI